MNKATKAFIDEFIRDYAEKSQSSYELAVGCDLSEDAENYLIQSMVKLEPKEVRNLILDFAQNLIDQRINLVECEDRYREGLSPRQDPVNGEIYWERVGGY